MSLQAQIEDLQLRCERQQQQNERLFDLVRHQRGELHEAGLITNEEYAHLLVEGSSSKAMSVARLQTYDQMRAEIDQLKATLRKLEGERR